MNTIATTTLDTTGFHRKPPSQQDHFLVVVVYEDEATFLRAESICSRLVKEFHDAEFDCLWVAFQGLTHEDLAKEAAARATKADLVIFSAHAGTELPNIVKQWIEGWLPQKNLEEAALAALIGLPTDEQKGVTPIHAYLQEIAARAHMDFLPQIIPPPGVVSIQSDAPLESSLRPTEFLKFPTPPVHWGINE